MHKVVHKCNESYTKCTTKGIRTTEKEYVRFHFAWKLSSYFDEKCHHRCPTWKTPNGKRERVPVLCERASREREEWLNFSAQNPTSFRNDQVAFKQTRRKRTIVNFQVLKELPLERIWHYHIGEILERPYKQNLHKLNGNNLIGLDFWLCGLKTHPIFFVSHREMACLKSLFAHCSIDNF